MLLRLALLRLALLHKATTTTVLALFPFLRLTFSLLSVFGRMRTMAKLLLVRRYLHIVRSQCTSCKRGRCMSRCCEIHLRTACVMYTCFITPNQCPCLMRPLPCMAICSSYAATQRRGGWQATTSLFLPCRVSVGPDGRAWTTGGRGAPRTTAAITENDYVAFFHQFFGLTNNPALAPFANVPCPSVFHGW